MLSRVAPNEAQPATSKVPTAKSSVGREEAIKEIEVLGSYQPDLSMDQVVDMRKQHALSVDRAEEKAAGKTEDARDWSRDKSHDPDSRLALGRRKSSAGPGTSMGDESIIHPPSPIFTKRNMQEENTTGMSNNMFKHLTSEDMLSSELSRIHAKGIGEDRLLRSGDENFNAEASMNQDVVDVMHAGVDTQDFLELSGDEHGIHIAGEHTALTTHLFDQASLQRAMSGKGSYDLGSPVIARSHAHIDGCMAENVDLSQTMKSLQKLRQG